MEYVIDFFREGEILIFIFKDKGEWSWGVFVGVTVLLS